MKVQEKPQTILDSPGVRTWLSTYGVINNKSEKDLRRLIQQRDLRFGRWPHVPDNIKVNTPQSFWPSTRVMTTTGVCLRQLPVAVALRMQPCAELETWFKNAFAMDATVRDRGSPDTDTEPPESVLESSNEGTTASSTGDDVAMEDLVSGQSPSTQ